MEARFIISATVAAMFHAFVLLGFNHSHTPAVPLVKERKLTVLPPPIQVDLEDPAKSEDRSDVPAPQPKGEPEQLKPRLEDPPPLPRDPIFEQESEARRRAPTDVVSRISDAPIGVLEGVGSTPSRIPGVLSSDLLDNTPRARSQVSPTYPAAERSAGITGEVVVEFVVDETGRVQQPRIVRSTRAGFESATLRAVEKWRFEPGKKDGRAVRFRMVVPVQFSLDS
jgi:protein TonB